jgi:hypothetical protein
MDSLNATAFRNSPAHQSPQLEETVLTFVSNDLGFEMRNVTRGEKTRLRFITAMSTAED